MRDLHTPRFSLWCVELASAALQWSFGYHKFYLQHHQPKLSTKIPGKNKAWCNTNKLQNSRSSYGMQSPAEKIEPQKCAFNTWACRLAFQVMASHIHMHVMCSLHLSTLDKAPSSAAGLLSGLSTKRSWYAVLLSVLLPTSKRSCRCYQSQRHDYMDAEYDVVMFTQPNFKTPHLKTSWLA